MFKEWGFLISEMVVLLLLAALLGLIVGWIIWGRRVRVETKVETKTVVDHDAENKLRGELKDCQEGQQSRDQRIADLESQLATAQLAAEDSGGVDYDGDGVIEGADEGSKPETLTAARDGKADDLKMIKGAEGGETEFSKRVQDGGVY
ncbi:MAG: hypothetical protein CSA68_01085 [Rhodobacterales bacterium]|nr:MAG: hypothetical protein CSA68_01085 [Rhodobacterales bacterium]